MIDYLNSLLPRLRQFSHSLDKKSLLVDQPWVVVNNNQNFEKLIFKSNQDLIMSLNGKVSIGKWEYLIALKSLLIDRNDDKILLNQEFIEKGIMILKYDGFTSNFFILANENIIPDLNIERYMRNVFYNKCNISTIQSTNNKMFEVVRLSIDDEVGKIGQTVLMNSKDVNDCVFQSNESKVYYYIKDGKILKKSVVVEVETTDGTKLFVESFFYSFPENIKIGKGDVVKNEHNDLIPDGSYKLGFAHYIKVKNGLIV